MKNENISKINRLGKVSRILLVIMRIFLIMGFVIFLGFSVLMFTTPKDDVAVATMSAQVTVDDSTEYFVLSDIVKSGNFKISIIDELEEQDEEINILGTNVKLKIDETESNGKKIYDITTDIDAKTEKSMVSSVLFACIAGVVMLVVSLIVLIFGGKLAKALEVCNSPFEENVLKAMKRFAFSLIPVGVLEIIVSGNIISSTTIFIIIVIILFAFIFNYGAELQKESDETL